MNIIIKRRTKRKIKCDYCGQAIKMGYKYLVIETFTNGRKLNLHLACAQRMAKWINEECQKEIKRRLKGKH